jgi:hypothetical protein
MHILGQDLGKTIVPGGRYFDAAEERLRSMSIVEAIGLYEIAESAGYDADACAGGRWICHMLLGNFERAWLESDAIRVRGTPDPNRFWDGRPFDGRRVLIRCLHGLGDTIQFVRYARLIRERACSLIIETQPELKALIKGSHLADDVITWGEAQPAWDQQMEVIELPRVFRTTLHTIPVEIPYLDAAPSAASNQDERARPLRIGVAWQSSSYNPARSIPFGYMERLFAIDGASFFSLQAGDERAKLKPWSGRVADSYDPSGCVLATAAKLKTLDLLITADTMVAHLAGALGRPVWTLLPFQCDWRWMTIREDSPWYPTMRLFRQLQPRDWDAVIERVASELQTATVRGYASLYPFALPGSVK